VVESRNGGADDGGEAPACTPEVLRSTAGVYERLAAVVPPLEWAAHAPYVAAIERLKSERQAIVLAHN
jgi:quinolinate synthase